MPKHPGGAARRFPMLLCAALLSVALLPTGTSFAQEAPGVVPGTGARVAYTDGDGVLLRESPGYDAGVVVVLPEGTAVDVLDGPIAAPDGSAWYGAAAWGERGYIDAAFLAPLADAEPAPLPPPPAPDAVTAPELTSPSPPEGAALYVTDDVNLRAWPDLEAEVAAVVPLGSAVTLAGDGGEFVPVTYNGLAGWIASAYLSSEPVVAPEPAAAPAVESPPVTGTLPTVTTSAVNLRAGPSTDDAVITVIPVGVALRPTGEARDGFLQVDYDGVSGWVDAAYVAAATTSAEPADSESPAVSEIPEAPEPDPAPPTVEPGAATTTDRVNLRSGPSLSEAILDVIPAGTPVQTTGQGESGFIPVTYAGQAGWIDDAFLQTGDTPFPDFPDSNAVDAEPVDVAPRGGGIIWPFTGDGWYISQGYNGSSHQNQSSLWQYYYSFDLAQRDDSTAGETVISPVNGTVRWLDPATGGISIDIGNGHAVSLFHVTIDGGLAAGDPIRQGQYLGTVSGPGGPGFAGFAHIHFALWQTSDGGNWSRSAAPFVGPYAISGQEFPDIGGSNQYRGTAISA